MPGSTLPLLSFSQLHLRQNRVDDPEAPGAIVQWRSHIAVRDFLARNIPFPAITSLFLEWIDWQTLSRAALTSLQSNYNSVKELELNFIAITLDELSSLIETLSALEKITIRAGVPFDTPATSTLDSIKITHPSLSQLAFHDNPPSWLIRFFARAIHYAAGINTLSFGIPVTVSAHSHELEACGELLETAGINLRVLNFGASYYVQPLPGESGGETFSSSPVLSVASQ
ncbi:hypothetical protein C0991_004522 [Blastosporella zonata]|nr:hypothetical protein C0991_004522 [Blastosporella zonata]